MPMIPFNLWQRHHSSQTHNQRAEIGGDNRKIITPNNTVGRGEESSGELRFQKPVPIRDVGPRMNKTRPVKNVYNMTVVCPQAYPEWVINLTAVRRGTDRNTAARLLNGQAGQTEACLVLDVFVPESIFMQGVTAKG